MFGAKKSSVAIFRRKKGRFEVLDTCDSVSSTVQSLEMDSQEADSSAGNSASELANNVDTVSEPKLPAVPVVSKTAPVVMDRLPESSVPSVSIRRRG